MYITALYREIISRSTKENRSILMINVTLISKLYTKYEEAIHSGKSIEKIKDREQRTNAYKWATSLRIFILAI